MTPTLYLIAGPNGAGKSTYFDWAIHQEIIPNVEQVNGDVLYKNNPNLTQTDVAALVQQQIKAVCTSQESFSLESNLATESSYSVVDFARKNNYQISLHFLALDNPLRCRSRVEDRVQQGGHDVPVAIVEQRYRNGLSLVKQHYARFDEITFIDNSAEAFRVVAKVQNARLIFQAEALPNWTQQIVNHIQLRQRIRR